jgi:hypothetical protein
VDGDVATVKEIAVQTGMSIQTLRRRLRLASLTQPCAKHSTKERSPRASQTPPGCPSASSRCSPRNSLREAG